MKKFVCNNTKEGKDNLAGYKKSLSQYIGGKTALNFDNCLKTNNGFKKLKGKESINDMKLV